jgi:hypothetical protein
VGQLSQIRSSATPPAQPSADAKAGGSAAAQLVVLGRDAIMTRWSPLGIDHICCNDQNMFVMDA